MSKSEIIAAISFGLLIFIVVFVRINFFFGLTIHAYTLLFSLIIYLLGIIVTFLFVPIFRNIQKSGYISMAIFIFLMALFMGGATLLSHTYDTSWDGQGYHQSAVIALANDWNPVYSSDISFKQHLPSQIFAEGYPSALWEIEASIYALIGKINSAKIVNFYIAFIAILMTYILLRKFLLGKILSIFIATLITLQPIFILQLLTFMQDGFGYQLLVIASAALIIYAKNFREYWAIIVFILAEIFLVSLKYSFLPIALALGIIFGIIFINRLMNRDYRISKMFLTISLIFVFIAGVFSYLPYVRNQIAFDATFFPTNITELMGSVSYNNIPRNIQEKNKLSLLFYGIFSQSQSRESGDPRSQENIAQLKIPFTFTMEELENNGSHFNNRVGAGGPFFSGIVIISIIFLVLASLVTREKRERYAMYAAYFGIGLVFILAMLTPAPNLLRYVSQLQLIPFISAIPLLIFFKEFYIKTCALIILFIVAINSMLFGFSVGKEVVRDTRNINTQYAQMRDSQKEYRVRAQQFYSSYILLEEQNIPFMMVDHLKCQNIGQLVVSSTTTQYCK